MSRASPVEATASAPRRRLLKRPFGLLLLVACGLAAALAIAISATGSLSGRDWSTEAKFFWRQDLPVAAAFAALGLLLGLARDRLAPIAAIAHAPPRAWVGALAGFCFVSGVVGAWLIFAGYTFSLDEFLANFDAKIFASGHLFATIPAPWRSYTGALQPMYMLPLPNSLWASSYLPVNAALRGLASLAGLEPLLNPALSALSIVLVWAIARRLWPEEPRTALFAAALLGVSPQLIVMSMTAYAMPAHLAFNLAWLLLFLRGGRLGHAGAIATGWLATGLHQLIFHPIFAAPFIVQLWVGRRWRLAVLYTLAYAAICGFWVAWWPLVTHLAGVASPEDAPSMGDWLSDRVSTAFDHLSVGDIGVLGENLVRFVSWQAPLTVLLALAGTIPALLTRGPLRALVLGIVLTLVATSVAAPTQTHGWGYRYLHGLLGSFALIAAWMWSRLGSRLDPASRRAADGAFVAACAASLLVFTPLRMWQAHDYVRPYAAANAAIQSSPADVVVVDHNGAATLFDMGTVVRNDPFLARSPKVVALVMMPTPLVARLCATHQVALFNHVSASSFGIDVAPWRGPRWIYARRALMTKTGCGKLILASPKRP